MKVKQKIKKIKYHQKIKQNNKNKKLITIVKYVLKMIKSAVIMNIKNNKRFG